MSARDAAAEVVQLRELMHVLSDAVVTLTRKQAAYERFMGILGEPRNEKPEEEALTGYDAAAAIQARRRGLHLAGGTEAPQ